MGMKPGRKRFYCKKCDAYFQDAVLVPCPICKSKDNVNQVDVCGGI
jgi:Zn finger protein HypA/HybF involved in hydrogenase expression